MRYKATVSYDGTDFSGWQIQNQARTVQQCLNEALSCLTCQDIRVTGSGRTDGKVHAIGQVFHFDTDRKIADFARAINSQLPQDVFVKEVVEVPDDFHARFDARWKHYDYRVNDGQYDPLLRNYVCFANQKLDDKLMNRAKEVFIGTHDFTSFNSTKISENPDQIRTIYDIIITRKGNDICMSFYGNGFLRYMVRTIAACLIEAGKGRVTSEHLRSIMDRKDKTACTFNSQPQGLYLVEVGYQEYQMH